MKSFGFDDNIQKLNTPLPLAVEKTEDGMYHVSIPTIKGVSASCEILDVAVHALFTYGLPSVLQFNYIKHLN